MQSIEKVEGWVWEAARQAAESGHARMMRDIWTPVYVYFKRGSVTSRQDGNEPEMGYQLVTPERLPRNMTVDQLVLWIHDRLRRCPCLPEDM